MAPALEVGIGLFADGIARDVELDAPARLAQRAVLQRGKAGLAHDTLEHHAAGHADFDGGGLQRLCFSWAMGLLQRRRAIFGLEIVGKGHAVPALLAFAQFAQFFTPLGDELIFIYGRGGGE